MTVQLMRGGTRRTMVKLDCNSVRFSHLWIVVTGLTLVGCGSPTEPVSARPCPQTYEFGNRGCARIMLSLREPAEPWPRIRWDVRVHPDADLIVWDGGVDPFGYWSASQPDTILDVIWQFPPYPEVLDTASAWIVVRMLEDPRPVQVGVPLKVFAADSVLRVLRFSDVGTVPEADRVWLDLRRAR